MSHSPNTILFSVAIAALVLAFALSVRKASQMARSTQISMSDFWQQVAIVCMILTAIITHLGAAIFFSRNFN